MVDRNQRVYELFDRAVSLDPDTRSRFLDEECSEDPALRREIEQLLAIELQTRDLPVPPILDHGMEDRAAEPMPVPDRIGRYEVLGRLGAGGMGVVYLGVDVSLGRQVAIKSVPWALNGHQRTLQRFRDEARHLARFNHPNIATLYSLEEDGEEAGSQVFLTMEVIEGRSLADRLREGALSIDETLSVARQLAAAIGAAHARGIVHRDLKPSNVMLTDNGVVKVLDFGLAKLADVQGEEVVSGPADGRREPLPGELVRETRLAGTPGYMSPEQVRGNPTDHRTDIWSFGCVLYECLTGRAAFGTSSGVRLRATLDEKPDLQALPADIPAPLRELITSCLTSEAESRPASIVAAGETIERLVEERAGARAGGRGRTAAYTIVAALLIIAVATTFLVLRTARKPATEAPSTLKETQLTAIPNELWIADAAISPDGKTLAFTDKLGTFLQDIESKVVSAVPFPEGFRSGSWVRWHPTRNLLLSKLWGEGVAGWCLIAPDGSFERAPAAVDSLKRWDRLPYDARVSPDGTKYLVLTADYKEIWVVDADGGPARDVLRLAGETTAFSPVWSPTGNLIAYMRDVEGQEGYLIEAADLQGTTIPLVGPDPALVQGYALGGNHPRMCWLPDGRLIYSRAMPAPDWTSSELWSIAIDPNDGSRRGEPVRVTGEPGIGLNALSASAKGDRLAVIKLETHDDIYLADLDADGRFAGPPRRFEFDERPQQMGTWSRDGETIIFGSSRFGTMDVLAKKVDEPIPRKLVAGPEEEWPIGLTPEGDLLVARCPRGRFTSFRQERELLRVSANGDSITRIRSLAADETIQCGAVPGAPCVLGRAAGGEITFYRLDASWMPVAELGRAGVEGLVAGRFDWTLSPDGREIALVRGNGTIRLLDLESGEWRDLGTSPRRWQGVWFSPDGTSLYVTRMPNGIDRVTRDGRGEQVFESDFWLSSPRVSPDGKQLAFRIRNSDWDVWMLEGF